MSLGLVIVLVLILEPLLVNVGMGVQVVAMAVVVLMFNVLVGVFGVRVPMHSPVVMFVLVSVGMLMLGGLIHRCLISLN